VTSGRKNSGAGVPRASMVDETAIVPEIYPR
jgi:hypothetical protein